jgi:uncharacterized protein (TIGR00290 family)
MSNVEVKSPRQAALFWSGGKDSALALHRVRSERPDLRVVKLATCLSQAYDRVSMHGVRRQLIEDQGQAVGIPVDFVVIPHLDDPSWPMAHTTPGTTFPPNDTYTRTVLAAMERFKAEGIEVIVFGDIFLEDLRAFRERLLERVGLVGCYPLWGQDSGVLYDSFVALGYEGLTVCVDTSRLTAGHSGQLLTPAFRSTLPDGVDVCGERGEYHSFVFNGPLFRRPVPYRLGEAHHHAPFVFRELYPDGRTA